MAQSVRIELLDKDNYETLKIQVQALLTKTEGWQYVSGRNVRPCSTPGNEKLTDEWLAADEKAKADLILSISPSELKHVRRCVTARDVWLKLESIYASKGPARKAILLKQLTLHRMQEGEDVREHISNFVDAVDKLNDIGIEIHKDLLSILLLYSLPASYNNFRCAMESRDDLPTV